ncbi:MAG: hypothetical protein K8S27_07145 [Candidatus Omnitrophica bacterium]|nr:hypothetical protein [Candidatus Omnitrophota bacterium]
MITDLFFLFTTIAIPTVLGYLAVKSILLNERWPLLVELSISFGLGVGILVLLMFYFNILGLAFSYINILLVVFVAGLILFILYQHIKYSNNSFIDNDDNDTLPFGKMARSRDNEKKHSRLRSYISFFIGLNILTIVWIAMNVPISAWDALATIAFKAKIFYFEKGIPSLELLPHRTYPLLTPLLETWTSFNIGRWDDQLIKIFFPAGLISFLIISYYFLKLLTNKTYALCGIALLLSSNLFFLHATTAYRDSFLLYYNCSAIMFLILWSKYTKTNLLILSSMFASIATFVKLEGTAFMAVYFFVFFVILFFNRKDTAKKKLQLTLIYILPILLCCFSFHIYKSVHGLGISTDGKANLKLSLKNLLLLKNVFRSYSYDLFHSANWGLIWSTFLICFFLYSKRLKRKDVLLTLISIFCFFVLYTLVAIFTENYLWIAGNLKETGRSRLLLHFYPLGVFFITLITFPNPFKYDK